ncbi:MAG: glycoside hydrolase family 127 protein [Phycisphaerales bacterium]|nr:MAG: glycoside hydrolase family 127 protein [Phycisphaerales bacterium]
MHPWLPLPALLIAATTVATTAAHDSAGTAMLTPVPFTDVHIRDRFWSPRLETNRTVTIPYCFDKCDETGRLDNFAKAGGLMDGEFIGIRFNDSDVFKVIEAAAYSLSVKRDPELEKFLDDLISNIADAQEDDGYLFTTRTIDPDNPAGASGDTRWSYIIHSHELYNVGHMYEAAVAYYLATGKRAFLDVAIKNADLIDRVFGPGKRMDPPGHEEIEIGLVKLYHVTGDERYFKLAKFFIDQRGNAEGHELYGIYAQDHVPVIEQTEPIGHAVRAMYLYCGMADVAALTGDKDYLAALDRVWNNMVQRKLYLTGGVGARQSGEAFGEDYELPNASAYNETCAAIGNGLWNHRMNLLHSDAKYVDVLERVIYNGFLSGISMTGDRFFYPNPLSSGGTYHRSPWFSCSCCPVNVARFVPSIAGYVYAHDADAVYVNLYAAGTSEIKLPDNTVTITQTTDYPWDGAVRLAINPQQERTFDLKVRIPGWAVGKPVPSDLYEYADGGQGGLTILVNGETIARPNISKGYAVLSRQWERGDTVNINFDMPIRLVRCNNNVEENRGRLAIERGPLVYCLEAIDNGNHVRNIWLPADAKLVVEETPALLGGVTVIKGKAFALHQDEEDGPVQSSPIELTAIPYYAWDHREAGEMAVWIPADPRLAKVIPPPTAASISRVTASFCSSGDSPEAVNDQREPENSDDHSIPRMTWWDHLGTTEWIQYDFPEERWVSSAEVYWFDDTGHGACRVPAAWRLLFMEDGQWRPVPAASPCGVERDTFNRVDFDPIKTPALRLEVKLQEGYSGGILEWRIN